MLSPDTTRTNVPSNPAPIVEAVLFPETNNPSLEETLTKPEAEQPGDAPGKFRGTPAECCRTEICTCTRAVPHGSFL
jgi:hypothetical protein